MKLRDASCTRLCPIRKRMNPRDFVTSFGKDANDMMKAMRGMSKPDKRKHPCRLQTRVDMDTDYAFRTLCHERGKTVSDMLLELVKNAVAQAEGEV